MGEVITKEVSMDRCLGFGYRICQRDERGTLGIVGCLA